MLRAVLCEAWKNEPFVQEGLSGMDLRPRPVKCAPGGPAAAQCNEFDAGEPKAEARREVARELGCEDHPKAGSMSELALLDDAGDLDPEERLHLSFAAARAANWEGLRSSARSSSASKLWVFVAWGVLKERRRTGCLPSSPPPARPVCPALLADRSCKSDVSTFSCLLPPGLALRCCCCCCCCWFCWFCLPPPSPVG